MNCNNSPVYLCILDASNAFDKINHWCLFRKLLDMKLPTILVRLLNSWYSEQRYSVQWTNCTSELFYLSNGVPQGRILSLSFFTVYMDELSCMLTS